MGRSGLLLLCGSVVDHPPSLQSVEVVDSRPSDNQHRVRTGRAQRETGLKFYSKHISLVMDIKIQPPPLDREEVSLFYNQLFDHNV